MLSVDNILPVQFFQGAKGKDGEMGLLRAILSQAIDDIKRGNDNRNARCLRLWVDAYKWIHDDSLGARLWPASCCNICLCLGIDWGALRKAVNDNVKLARVGLIADLTKEERGGSIRVSRAVRREVARMTGVIEKGEREQVA